MELNVVERQSRGAPRWLIFLTVGLTLLILVMAVAETSLWTHFFIDTGEYLSLIGLGFIFVVGLYLHRTDRLLASLPLILPWLIYPVVTQGDQIIDNLDIYWMRTVTHLILAILFGSPIAVLVLAAKRLLEPSSGGRRRHRGWTRVFPGLRQIERGRVGEGAALMAVSLILIEIWVAFAFLGELMILTLIAMGLAVLFWVSVRDTAEGSSDAARPSGRRLALVVFLIGVAGSAGLYLGFKHRPGAYQGSPHYFHDPSQADAAYDLEAIAVPAVGAFDLARHDAQEIERVLAGYGGALEKLSAAYYVLDRNYNYAFHNELFMRNTPVLPAFRSKALADIGEARRAAFQASTRLRRILAAGPEDDPLLAFLREVESYTAFSFRRAAILEEMSGRFEQTRAGLQHATHLYEGEGKVLGVWLIDILAKHRDVLEVPGVEALVASFVSSCEAIHASYADRIVGF